MVKIGTHNGTFHCDEVLACYLLKQLPQYKEAEIVRSRDQKIIDTCDIVVDVGGIFDPLVQRYDHHQRSFKETFNTIKPEKPWNIKLSSAGLIYVYFGEQVLTELCKKYDSKIDINVLYEKMYANFVMEIDAIDNGVSVCEGEPNYAVLSSLSSRVGHINPWWNQESADENTLFMKAVEMVGSEFEDRLNFYVNCWWPARELVQSAIDNRFVVHESGAILKFERGGCPWKSHFFDLEETILTADGDARPNGAADSDSFKIKFVLYADKDSWRVQCIPISEQQCFQNRLGLLDCWRGLRGEELSALSGIPGCVFVHSNGFIGGNATFEGALEMAARTLKFAEINKLS